MEADPQNAPLTSVFVYGTLMPGQRNEHVARLGGHFTARPARLGGFRLFHLHPENYPGITPAAAAHSVQGHLLTYIPPDWARARALLDDLEGLDDSPPLYTRQKVQVEQANGERSDAWVYVYARPERLQAPGVLSIEGGDWRDSRGDDR